MDLLAGDPDPSTPARLALERDRVCDRLRSMSLVRLRAELAGGQTRARAAGVAAQRLADLGADLGGWPRRPVPELPAHAVEDQVAVLANDLLATVGGCGGPGQREACRAGVDVLVGLRRVL